MNLLKLNTLANKYSISIAQLSLLWVYSLKDVTKLIIGFDSLNQLENCLQTPTIKIEPYVFNEALDINCTRKELNPSLW